MKNYKSIWLQVLVWLGLWFVFVFALDAELRPSSFYWLSTIRVLILAVFFNLVYQCLMPLYFADRKRIFYLLSILSLIAFVGIHIMIDYHMFTPDQYIPHSKDMPPPPGDIAPPPERNRPLFLLIVPPTFISLALFGVAAALRGFYAFEKKKKAVEEAEKQQLISELALLKSQINPHFLLNTLNNLYTLSITDAEKTPDALLKLSNMMKYILHDCTSPKVPLNHDVSFVKDYLELQELRLPSNVRLITKFPSSIPSHIQIEPMILIPFIENAFKHGITTRRTCEIFVTIELNEYCLYLFVQNDLIENTIPSRDYSGIGLDNTIKRLQITYNSTHSLQMETIDKKYSVQLKLQLS